jgi:dGTPase
MFRSVYTNPVAKGEESKARNLLEGLFYYYMEHPETMSEEYLAMLSTGQDPREIVVCDYISGMTDQYAIYKFQEFYVPKAWNV